MNTRANPYDVLYNNLKNRFTVIHGGQECTVGDYMRMKSGAHPTSNLPAVRKNSDEHSIAAVINYVNDKLTIKKAPLKDKTMRRFPIRTSLSATLSAVAACALIMFTGIIAAKGVGDTSLPTVKEPAIETADEIVDDNNLGASSNPYTER